MKTVVSVARLQGYLRHTARERYETVAVPSFTLFLHPTDDLTYFNYAIPDHPWADDLGHALSVLREAFAARGRHPRIEFIEAFAPQLGPALRAAGFVEEARQQLMVCTVETYQPAPPMSGLTVAELTGASAVSEVQAYLNLQRRGFDPRDEGRATAEDAEHFLRTIGEGRAFVASLDGQPVGVGMFTAPFAGVTEIAGLATLAPFRRRGIATRLTALAARRAMTQGADVVTLTAADERAGRVYERVGFVGRATMLAYADPGGWGPSPSP